MPTYFIKLIRKEKVLNSILKNLNCFNTCNKIKYYMAIHITMVDNMPYAFSICNKNQSTMTKHIITINKYIFYQYIFPSVCLKWGFFISAWNMNAIYIQSKPINIINSGFDSQYTIKFENVWTWFKDIIIWQHKKMMTISHVSNLDTQEEEWKYKYEDY